VLGAPGCPLQALLCGHGLLEGQGALNDALFERGVQVAQGCFRTLQRINILDHHDGARDLPLGVVERGCHDARPDLASVLVHIEKLDARCHNVAAQSTRTGPAVRLQGTAVIGERAPACHALRITRGDARRYEGAHAGVADDQIPLGVDQTDCDRQLLQHSRQTRLALAQSRLRLLPRRDVLNDSDAVLRYSCRIADYRTR
jgi:hypothetical protein